MLYWNKPGKKYITVDGEEYGREDWSDDRKDLESQVGGWFGYSDYKIVKRDDTYILYVR